MVALAYMQIRAGDGAIVCLQFCSTVLPQTSQFDHELLKSLEKHPMVTRERMHTDGVSGAQGIAGPSESGATDW